MTLSSRRYLTLRNTVRILRGAGVELSEEQERDVQQWEAAIKQYEGSTEMKAKVEAKFTITIFIPVARRPIVNEGFDTLSYEQCGNVNVESNTLSFTRPHGQQIITNLGWICKEETGQ